jgi:prepilin-type N-terminal cleavage/methylation domain-containing protein
VAEWLKAHAWKACVPAMVPQVRILFSPPSKKSSPRTALFTWGVPAILKCMKRVGKQTGFTIVELLIVIVVIGILAAITIAAFNGVQQRTRDTRRLSDIQTVHKALQLYYADNGSYPVTATPFGDGLSDANCTVGSKSTLWVPGLVPKYLSSLPQSFGPRAEATSGCYEYASDGAQYILSAWHNIEAGPQGGAFYRRVGFHEGWAVGAGAVSYYCANGAAPAYWDAYYKYSYTYSNVTTCNES